MAGYVVSIRLETRWVDPAQVWVVRRDPVIEAAITALGY